MGVVFRHRELVSATLVCLWQKRGQLSCLACLHASACIGQHAMHCAASCSACRVPDHRSACSVLGLEDQQDLHPGKSGLVQVLL